MSSIETPDCPKCGASMIIRISTLTRVRFWGCTDYPACAETLPVVEGETALRRDDPSLPSDRFRTNDKRRWERE